MYETKQMAHEIKSIEGRTVTGIFCVHGNIDEGGDRSLPGSFASTTIKGRDRVRFLWQHNSNEPPVATVDDIHEVSRLDLPSSVLAYAPDAMGGVQITRTYLETPRANEILTGIKAGAIDEMSYAYEATNATFEEVDGRQIRNIHEIKLFDASDVNWGMNAATVASKSGGLHAGLPFQVHSATVLAAVEEFIDRARDIQSLRAKEGRMLSAANVVRLQGLYDALAAAAGDLKTLLDSTAPPKADTNAVRLALMEFERIQAHLRGVKL